MNKNDFIGLCIIGLLIALFVVILMQEPADINVDVNIEQPPVVQSIVPSQAENGIGGTTHYSGIVHAEGLTITDDAEVQDELTVDDATYTCKDFTFVDATTTPVALAATSLFSSGSMTITGFVYNNPTAGVATSTHSIDCGVAADQYTSSDTLMDGLSVATSTAAYQSGNYGTNGKASLPLDTTEYVTCTVTLTGGAAYDGAFLDGGNTYDGSITVCAFQ